MNNIYQRSKTQPYHISVGGVLFNDEGNIATLRHVPEMLPASYLPAFRTHKEAFSLMRESLEKGETLVCALERGFREEFGATISVRHFCGSLVTEIHDDMIFEKTTLYFSAHCIHIDENDRSGPDVESDLDIVWWEPSELITHMQRQADIIEFDLDESKIVERAVALMDI